MKGGESRVTWRGEGERGEREGSRLREALIPLFNSRRPIDFATQRERGRAVGETHLPHIPRQRGKNVYLGYGTRRRRRRRRAEIARQTDRHADTIVKKGGSGIR